MLGSASEALRRLSLGEMFAAQRWLLHGGPHPVAGMTPLVADGEGRPPAIHLTPGARQAVIGDAIAALAAAASEAQVCIHTLDPGKR